MPLKSGECRLSETMSVEVKNACRPKFMLQATHQNTSDPNTHTTVLRVQTANSTLNTKKIEKCNSNSGIDSRYVGSQNPVRSPMAVQVPTTNSTA